MPLISSLFVLHSSLFTLRSSLFTLKRLPVLILILVFEHGEIALVSAGSDIMLLHRLDDGASRLMGVGAIGEPTALRELEYLLEVASELLLLDVERAESLDARSVYQIATARQVYHLAEGRGVHARVVSVADLSRALSSLGHQLVDESRFAHATVAAQERSLVLYQRSERVDALACCGGDFHALVADGLVERAHHLLVVQFVVGEHVSLVEHQDHRHTISLGSSQEPVYEGGGSLRIVDRHDEQRLIDVGGEYMALLAQVWRLTDDVVAPVLYRGDEGSALLVGDQFHAVAHSHGIGAADALQSEVSLDFAFDKLAIVGLDGVPASCILND